MKRRVILIGLAVVLLAAALVIGNLKDTVRLSGVLEGDNAQEVTITITRTNFDKLFNRMSKNMTVAGEQVNYEYIFAGPIFEMEGYFAAPVRRMNVDGLATQGYLLFDGDLHNAVIQTPREMIYAASDAFISMVLK